MGKECLLANLAMLVTSSVLVPGIPSWCQGEPLDARVDMHHAGFDRGSVAPDGLH